ncbi:hypothetical protein KR50_17610 [Jeotgalibacillus campisalis]|uniref:Uncharacterized protein n=1 Tax=Jeotgalibacillus campisalis TaxID=220754 RepID=A0A0C2S0M8_9BACL|nr:hypothetical protein KR50_17610 [Jeotgalibacillus campisalis]
MIIKEPGIFGSFIKFTYFTLTPCTILDQQTSYMLHPAAFDFLFNYKRRRII